MVVGMGLAFFAGGLPVLSPCVLPLGPIVMAQRIDASVGVREWLPRESCGADYLGRWRSKRYLVAAVVLLTNE